MIYYVTIHASRAIPVGSSAHTKLNKIGNFNTLKSCRCLFNLGDLLKTPWMEEGIYSIYMHIGKNIGLGSPCLENTPICYMSLYAPQTSNTPEHESAAMSPPARAAEVWPARHLHWPSKKKDGNKTGASKNDPENKKMEDHRRSWKKSLWNDHLWSMMVSWNVLDVISSARSTKNKSFPACQTSVHPQSGRVAGLTCWEILYRHPLHFAQKEWDGNPSACSCPRLQFVQPQPAWAGVETRVPKISETTPKTPQYGIMKVPDRSVHE